MQDITTDYISTAFQAQYVVEAVQILTLHLIIDLIDLSILKYFFKFFSCPDCHWTDCFEIEDMNKKKRGLARCLQLVCTLCQYTLFFYTSKQKDVIKKRATQDQEW